MNEKEKIFLNYASNYKEYGKLIQLKIDHTFRVEKLCEDIALSLNLSKEDVELAKLCGLLHDIARFEQLKTYNTFVDIESVDHGDLGVEILKNEKLIYDYNSNREDDNLIINAVKYHNKYEISPNLSEREKLFCNIVRDADKLDILYLYTMKVLKVDTNNEIFSDDILELLSENKLIPRIYKKTKADTLAISLGLVFDMNFSKSYEILKKKNYMNKEIDIYEKENNNPKFLEQLSIIKNIINNYINKKNI